MKGTEWVYVISLALQLSGGLILLRNLFKRNADNMVEAERQKPVVAYTEEEAREKMEKVMREVYFSKYNDMYSNRFAFGYLVLGYFLSIWGNNGYPNKIYIAIWTAMACAVCYLIAHFFSVLGGKNKAKKRDYSKLPEGMVWCVPEKGIEKEKEKEDVLNNEEESKKIDKGEKKAELIVAILSILGVGYAIVNEVYKLLYQIACESHYKIPRKLFITDVKESLIYFGLGILLLIFLGWPAILRITNQKAEETEKKRSRILSIFVAILLGATYGLMNILYIHYIPWVRKFIISDDAGGLICSLLVLVMGIGAFLGFSLIPEIFQKKKERGGSIYYYMWLIATIVTAGIFLVRIGYGLDNSVDKKTQYEVVLDGEKKYAVISDNDELILVVEYEEKEGITYFYTGAYELLHRDEYTYYYKNFGSVPEIVCAKKDDSIADGEE